MEETTVQSILKKWIMLSRIEFDEFMLNQGKTLLREEKEQICNAWDNGFANGFDLGKYDDDSNPDDANKYYLKNFKTD